MPFVKPPSLEVQQKIDCLVGRDWKTTEALSTRSQAVSIVWPAGTGGVPGR